MKQGSRVQSSGFTLVELLIAAAVSTVLASLAYPALTGSIQKVRRAGALVAVMQLQQAQERWRSDSPSYGTLSELKASSTAVGGSYLLSVSDPSATGYEILATASGAQSGDGQCRYMKLSVDGGSQRYRSGPTPALDNEPQLNRRCWNQ